MPVVERIRGLADRLTLAAAVVALLVGAELVRDLRAGGVSVLGTGGEERPQGGAAEPREPTFEEEMERLHPRQLTTAAMCRAGSGSGSGGCCCGGRAGSGGGSGSGSGRSSGLNQCSTCGGRTGQ